MPVVTLADPRTPCLVLDRAVLKLNIDRMAGGMRALGVELRPHLKTAKCLEVARLATAGFETRITVSTLAEAEWFSSRGMRDITLAVGITPGKWDAVRALRAGGADIAVITDNPIVATAIAARGNDTSEHAVRVLIEIDCGDHRAGVAPDSPDLTAIAEIVERARGLDLAGVLTHAGHSYHAGSIARIQEIAEAERAAVVTAAERLRASGFACPNVSAGSTPTATHATNLEGVTEMRPGVYMFGDLDQVGIGTCTRDDIALTVLACVIGHYPARNELIVDAGGLALSKDQSAGRHTARVGYGLVRAIDGAPIDGLYVARVSQEHGVVTAPTPLAFADVPIGSRVRIVPNHACMTAAAHSRYHVVDGGATVSAVWERCCGW